MKSEALLRKRLLRIDTDVQYLLEEIKDKKIKKKFAIEEFEKLQNSISRRIKEPADLTQIVRDMRTKDYLI
jgi:hypothetical protein